MNLDNYIEGTYNEDNPANKLESDTRSFEDVMFELDNEDKDIIYEEIAYHELEIKRLMDAYKGKQKAIEMLVDNTRDMDSHTYIRNILKELFL